MLEREIERCEWVTFWPGKKSGCEQISSFWLWLCTTTIEIGGGELPQILIEFHLCRRRWQFSNGKQSISRGNWSVKNKHPAGCWVASAKESSELDFYVYGDERRQVENHYLLCYCAQTWEKIVLTLLYKKTQSGDAGRFLYFFLETKRQLKQRNQFPESCSIKVWMNQEFRSGFFLGSSNNGLWERNRCHSSTEITFSIM